MQGRARARPVGRAPTPAGPGADGGRLVRLDHLRADVGNRAFAAVVARQLGGALATGIVGLRAGDGVAAGTAGRRPQVTSLQEQLNARVGAGLAPDGRWGRRTTDAVRRAQLLAGLAVAQVVDQAFADFLAGAPPATVVRSGAALLVGLKRGDGLDADKRDVENRVRLLQSKLGERGFPVRPDGLWGSTTDTALRAFQASAGLTAGSPVDVATAEALLGGAQATTIGAGSATAISAEVRSERRPFGNYVVLPNGRTRADFPDLVLDPTAEVVTESAFAAVKVVWDELVSGEGTMQVGRFDPDGNEVPGFRDRMLAALGTLLGKPVGRQLISDIRSLGRLLLLAPDRRMNAPAGQRRSGGPVTVRDTGRGLAPPVGNGLASDSTILMPPDLDDTTFVALDSAGQPLRTPMFEILGHELGHTLHNAQGLNRTGESPSHPSFNNREEENTDDIENLIRDEHGLAGHRFRHGARRRRPTDFPGG